MRHAYRWFLSFALILGACGGNEDSGSPDAAVAPALDIEFIAHASFKLTGAEGTSVLVDPYASRVWLGYDFPLSYANADVVVSTHPHYDHDGGSFIGREVPWADSANLLTDPADGRTIGEFTFTGVAGRHAEPYGQEFDYKNTLWIIEHAGLRVVHWGDNGPIDAALSEALGTVHVLFLPIDGEEHILSYQAVDDILTELQPAIVIPMHYRHPDLESSVDSPEDLGPIDPWLDVQTDAAAIGSHQMSVSVDRLPDSPEARVLDHSPLVTAP